VKVPHRLAPDSAVFDGDNLVSCTGLVPVMTLAERTGLVELLAEKVHIAEPEVTSLRRYPAPKLATLVGMCAGAESIDDNDVVRSGGMTTLLVACTRPARSARAFVDIDARGVDVGVLCGSGRGGEMARNRT
jgi:hypothetical protein